MIDKNNFAAAIRAADGIEQPGEIPLAGLFGIKRFKAMVESTYSI